MSTPFLKAIREEGREQNRLVMKEKAYGWTRHVKYLSQEKRVVSLTLWNCSLVLWATVSDNWWWCELQTRDTYMFVRGDESMWGTFTFLGLGRAVRVRIKLPLRRNELLFLFLFLINHILVNINVCLIVASSCHGRGDYIPRKLSLTLQDKLVNGTKREERLRTWYMAVQYPPQYIALRAREKASSWLIIVPASKPTTDPSVGI